MRAAFLALALMGCASAPLRDPPSCVEKLPYAGGPVVAQGREQMGSTQYASVSLGRCAKLMGQVRQA